MDGVLGINRCRLLSLEWISHEILLRGIGNYVWSLRMGHENVRKRMYTYMCNWVTMLYSRKLTEFCKPAIMEKIKIIICVCVYVCVFMEHGLVVISPLTL